MIAEGIDCSRHPDVELDPMQLTRDRSGADAMSYFNKSMDMGRHAAGKSSKPSFTQTMHQSAESNLFGESFATMGESFMGESFANMGDASFALLNGGDDFSYSDSNDDGDLEITCAQRTAVRQELETVLDIEEEEEEDETEKPMEANYIEPNNFSVSI